MRYPPQMAKSILKQSLQTLEFLHENGIAHGDFQLGNMLFALNDIDLKPEDVFRQEEDMQAWSISPPVQRLDGKQDEWAPRYLCIAQPMAPFTHYTEGFKIMASQAGQWLASAMTQRNNHRPCRFSAVHEKRKQFYSGKVASRPQLQHNRAQQRKSLQGRSVFVAKRKQK
ncbi:hypothetical protein QBC46DRAFT_412290 [Diplogelasinospora grovesii]|uniref:Protein kinase domain-containing protein n=1 Tax=Diplogelasinospora grovesii TaxID=303347 RepID=A0AAN6N2G4_9PEZI|nr:hypothetical protein QBC46DRAFT_412290 [Diplogelasinospora grovesii]